MAGLVATLTELRRASSLAYRIVGTTARYTLDDLIGDSAAARHVRALAEAAAGSEASLLLTGESGTGKEVLAQAVHNASPRAGGPFVAINCAAIPRDLLESELFGYEDAAFTGARKGGRPGKFELAEGGTLLLDEIGDMPLDMQVKLLRVLQEKTVSRLGGARELPVTCRIIATTNRELDDDVARGLFRRDLYYRLRVIHIVVPALRERAGDVTALTEHFLRRHAAATGKRLTVIAADVMAALGAHTWPGNIRELEHVIESAVALAPVDATVIGALPVRLGQRATPPSSPPPLGPGAPAPPPTAPARGSSGWSSRARSRPRPSSARRCGCARSPAIPTSPASSSRSTASAPAGPRSRSCAARWRGCGPAASRCSRTWWRRPRATTGWRRRPTRSTSTPAAACG